MAIAQRCHYSMRSGAETHWTLPAVIVLWTSLWAIASSFPTPNRTNATLLERKWETLFSRSYLGVNGGRSQLNWQSDYLQGIKRVRRLYCNVGIGFHLQVLPDGRISGLCEISESKNNSTVQLENMTRMHDADLFLPRCRTLMLLSARCKPPTMSNMQKADYGTQYRASSESLYGTVRNSAQLSPTSC
uniref:Fibroblast growth factor 6b n=1 Tax=Poecilia mexicana TaxID=48701 RepID=A0A3B3YX84_9TELE